VPFEQGPGPERGMAAVGCAKMVMTRPSIRPSAERSSGADPKPFRGRCRPLGRKLAHMLAEEYWQEILPPDALVASGYPARFDDGRILVLPIRELPDGKHALASLIINQASFTVVDALAAALAEKLRPYAPEVIVGLPTLGLTLASAVARLLGHARFVPLGNSAKFWYRAEFSVPLSSVTTPNQDKRLFVDPRMLPLLQERRVALVDDVISSGTSMHAAITLLQACGVKPAVLAAAMLQSDAWQGRLAGWGVVSVLRSPLLTIG
jgi:adenine/guanine phosphoribosyltransferase-like PRPP-binding protein